MPTNYIILRRKQSGSNMFVECIVEYKDWVLFVYAVSHSVGPGPEDRVALGSGQASVPARAATSAVMAAHLTVTIMCHRSEGFDPTPKVIG